MSDPESRSTEDWLTQVRRRKVVQWLLGYAAMAFALVQGVDMVGQRFDWPAAVSRASIIVAVAGACATVVLAWFHGERGQQRATAGEVVLLAVIAIAGAALAWRFAPVPAAAPPALPQAARTASATATAMDPAIPKQSIAVLPFADLSPDRDQEYFSDGMAEELLNALAKVQGLKVAGRTSAFSFKGKNEDLREIGRALAVAHVLEGSVRKQGERVRITAQLIQAEDGYHLWSETYDGDLKDVFALQERIARAITEQLKGMLSGPDSAPVVKVATTNPEAYSLYLQASSIFNRREGPRMGEAIAMLERALVLDPGFARAEARLAAILALAPLYLDMSDAPARVDEHARRASELDATLGEPYAARAQSRVRQRKYLEAWPEFERALSLEPDDVTANFWHAIYLVGTGYSRTGTAKLDRVLALDPLLPNALFWRGFQYLSAGDVAAARRAFSLAQDQRLAFASDGLGHVELAEGHPDKALPLLVAGLRALQIDISESDADLLARATVGQAEAQAAARALFERSAAGHDGAMPPVFLRTMVLMGDAERFLQSAATHVSRNEAAFVPLFWWPGSHAVRRHAAFPDYVRKTGLAELWDVHGAPDSCRRIAPGDYRCE